MVPAPDDPWGVVHDGAVAVNGGRIAWVGASADVPPDAVKSATHVRDCGGAWITPGLVDCHTHLVFAGDRWREFALRLKGATYEEIARAGGGIRSTVAATRRATEEELLAGAEARVRALAARGVTTVEVKSGYGLETTTEIAMLRVARRLAEALPVSVRTTFLGAHTLPPEYEDDRAGYLRLVCEEMIPRVAHEGWADAVDAFGERIAFTPDEVRRVFEAARAHGLPVRLHADQLSDQGGAALAASFGALSADHLEYTSLAGVRAMAGAGTAAVLLPGAFYVLGEEHAPPVEALRSEGVPIAVATDLNPGSSPLLSPLLAMNLACVLFGLTPDEAVAGMTRHAARALGLDAEIGTLEAGKRADLAVWEVMHPAELCYWIGGDPLLERVVAGEPAPL